MKRIIIALMLVMSSFICSAQITRNIWGLELGKSTKQQIIDVLKQKGFTPTIDDATNTISIEAGNFNFGGGLWTYASFMLYEGRLYEVWFQNNEYELPVAIFVQFNKLKDAIDKKYGQYRYTSTETDPENEKDYFDGNTRFYLSRRIYNNVGYISITYSDDILLNKKIDGEQDEL